ncbi:GNAT family N-acetyltransferase [Cellvibrio mixtus]|jgi:N-acyl amino acid synthase of PEP-CTERM/exosortase system|uniref:GNAT family N-acetyltransferase n=1 Tax=Cellvibrio mixtus TaxID=39650 RepID=A0A266Q8A6_9GAMM|nr:MULTISPECIES: PEP-CTERM/exosortase system-associated acyltransferase [Cellvibrio]AQT60091.1 GNAT family N-acetyltransferase [Cellvibrio sp. PSBB023]OZY86124.1 GNAT family N-acetyltransferase [Cellvibrio mixtus]
MKTTALPSQPLEQQATSTPINATHPVTGNVAREDATAIAKHFSQYLKPQIALSEELKREVYKLRHKVYCEELHFEDEKPQHMEQDEFDPRSVHCAIRHLNSNQLAGTVRVITTKHSTELLPLQQYCAHAITHESLAPTNFLPHQICELSRLAVPALFRKRITDKQDGAAIGVINEESFSAHEMRAFPYIAVSLYLSAMALCHKTRRVHIYLMMEPRLARSLKFVGIHCTQLGPVIEYHGQRAAYYVDVREARRTLNPGYRKLLTFIEAELFDHTQITV